MKLISSPTVTETTPHHSTRAAYLLMLASTFFFATMSACAHAAGERSGEWRFGAVARAGLVFLLAFCIARLQKVPLIWLGSRTLWIRSLTGSVSMLLTFFALTHLHVATAITLTNTFPLWVAILAWPALGERPTLGTVLALVGGIAGVVLIERPDQGDFRWASVAALAAAVCTAIVMIGLNRLRAMHPLAIVVHFSAVATVACVGYTLITASAGTPIELARLADPILLALLAGIAVCGTGGQILMTRAFQMAPPQKLAVVGLCQVVFALGFDLLIQPDAPASLTLVGIALVVTPVGWLLTHQPARSPTQAASATITS